MKKYYWLKLKDDFFRQKEIKKLRRVAGGDTYTIIYLKMQLLSLKRGGRLIFEGIEDSFAEELALELDEDEDNVQLTLNFLTKYGLIVSADEDDEFVLTETVNCIGKETAGAERVRRHRERKKALHGNANETNCNTEIRDKREELEKDKELEKDSSYRQAKEEVVTEVMKFCQKNQYKLKKDDAVQLIETYGSNTLKKAIVTTMSTEAYKNGKINGKNSYLIKVLNDLSSEQNKIVNIKYEKREQSKANFTERDDYDYDALENGLSGIGDKVPDSSSINEFLSKYREE
ncbi:phage replisome organizer N-terminal domain-containing protein [Clostridium perfringens]|uniref:phage replisome organizer N-terminal domain-containing protein n=1 Tax=Clostridium perfringens TaxID=1502 RepID=UPI00096A9C31|nr:phage replisome organizer N-terminal domain-containing protein [Clostridium perfringens]